MSLSTIAVALDALFLRRDGLRRERQVTDLDVSSPPDRFVTAYMYFVTAYM